ETTPTGLAAARRVLPNPKEAPDFYWMFLTRLLLMLAQAIALFFLLYYLRDRIGFHDPELGVLILTAVFAGCVVATAVWSGWFSDKLGVRKPFILFSATGVAAACAVLAFTSSFTMVVVGAVILGLSWGVYQAIDQALVNAVLPTEQERATHMGLINLAVLLPNTLAPSIAAIALSLLGGYTGLYLLAGAMCLAGGVLVLKIQSTRYAQNFPRARSTEDSTTEGEHDANLSHHLPAPGQAADGDGNVPPTDRRRRPEQQLVRVGPAPRRHRRRHQPPAPQRPLEPVAGGHRTHGLPGAQDLPDGYRMVPLRTRTRPVGRESS